MKKYLSFCLALLLGVQSLLAFDWQPQSNAALFRDMIEFARQFAVDARGTKAEKMLDEFIVKQEQKFEYDPLSWIEDTYKFVAKLEENFPPMVDDGSQQALIRRDIVLLVDFPVHVDNISAAATPEIKQAFEIARDNYRARARKKAFDWLKKTKVKPGELGIFKVYNMGYIFRTSERTFAIDLCWHGNKAESERMAKELSVVFVTHPHGDHYTDVMMQAMVDKGKKVFCSDPRVGKNIGDNPLRTISWADIMEPMDVEGIQVRTLAGHQNRKDPASMPNNVYHFAFDGWTIVHNGDNSDAERDARVSEWSAPDVLIGASWNKLQRLQTAAKACKDADSSRILFIPSHENEFGHRVQQRESYRELFSRTDRLGNPEYDYLPFELMDIGEGIILKK